MQNVYIPKEERNERNYLEYKPIDCSFRYIKVLTTWNIYDILPKSKHDNFQYVPWEHSSILSHSPFLHFHCCFL